MPLPFLIVEALALIGVPTVVAICLKLVLDDARREKARREVELAELRKNIDRNLRDRSEELQKAMAGSVEDFVRTVKQVHVSRQGPLDLSTYKGGASPYRGTRLSPARSSFKARDRVEERRR